MASGNGRKWVVSRRFTKDSGGFQRFDTFMRVFSSKTNFTDVYILVLDVCWSFTRPIHADQFYEAIFNNLCIFHLTSREIVKVDTFDLHHWRN